MDCSTPGFPVLHCLLELAQTHVHRVCDATQSSHPLLSPSPPDFNLSQHQSPFQWVNSCIRWSKYWSFRISTSPSNEYSGLLSFRMDWLDRCPRDSQELSPTPQFKRINSSALSLLYVPNPTSIHYYWKNHNFTIWTFVGKATSLLFNMLSRFVIAFLPRRKCLLISWLQSPSAVILESRKMKSVTISIVSSPICHEVMGPDTMIWMLSFKPAFSLSSFTFIKRLFSSSLLYAIRVVSSACLRLLFILAILIPACASSSLAFLMMYFAYNLNKQGDNIQPWCTPFPVWKQSVVPCPVLTVASWPACRFLRRQVRCYFHVIPQCCCC